MKGTITRAGNELVVKTPYDEKVKNALKMIDGRRWCKDRRAWVYPATSASAEVLVEVLAWADCDVSLDDGSELLLSKWRAGARVLEDGDFDPMPECPTKPFKHQELGFRLIEARDGAYLAWDMGTGKSKTVVDAVCLLGLRRVLVVCPTTVMLEWPGQFERHGDGGPVVVALDTRRSVAKRADELARWCDGSDKPVVFLVNYEAVWRPPLGPEMIKRGRGEVVDPRNLGTILSREWDMVVADEIHRIKSGRGKASRFFEELASRARRRVGLTGTPMPNNPLDLWAQMRFVDAGLFGKTFTTFRARYAHMGGYEGHQVVGFKNLDDLNKRFFMVAHKIVKREVLDLPPTTHETRRIELRKETRELYESVEEDFVTRIEEGEITVSNALTQLLRLQQITGGSVGLDGGGVKQVGDEKSAALLELLADLPPTEPVVVFCRFLHDVAETRRIAEKLDRRCFLLTGAAKQLNEWRDDDSGSVLAVQINSGGVGIDLTRAGYCVYYSLGFSLGDYEQSVARLDRQGQTRPVTYYHLVAKETVDEKVYGALRSKRKVVETVLDAYSAVGFKMK